MTNEQSNEQTRQNAQEKSVLKKGIVKSILMVAVAIGLIYIILYLVSETNEAFGNKENFVFLYVAPAVIILFAAFKVANLVKGKE